MCVCVCVCVCVHNVNTKSTTLGDCQSLADVIMKLYMITTENGEKEDLTFPGNYLSNNTNVF